MNDPAPQHPAPIRVPDNLSRRQFLTRAGATGLAAAGAAAGGYALWQPKHFVPGFEVEEGRRLKSFAVESAKTLPSMAIAHGTDHRAVVRAVVGALGGIERFIKNGDIVVLKPNVAFDRPPALGATTHPETLRAVAELVLEAGASKVLVADNPINSPAGCFLKSGLRTVANDLNLDLIYPEEGRFGRLELEGQVLRRWPFFFGPFEKAHKVIGVAPCKDHNLCHASMTMKNWYGLLGGRRNQFHQHIHSIVSDFALMMKPTFVILDGINVLMRNGPTGGRVSDVKQAHTMVAGTDMVAVDSYGCQHLLGRDTALLEYLKLAHDKGWGNMHWKDLNPKEVQI